MLADADRDDRVAVRGQLPQLVDGVLRRDAVGRSCRSLNGSVFFQAAICACQAARSSGASTILFSSASAYLTSLTIGMWAALFLLISDGSMSMCTILPCLANSDDLAGHAIVEPHAEGQQQIGLVRRRSWRTRCRACRACRATAGRSPGKAPRPITRHRDGNAGFAAPARAARRWRRRMMTPPPA